MLTWEGRGLGDIYLRVFRHLKGHGKKVTIRGHKCVELEEPVTLTYTHPGFCWMKIPNRKFNPFFALAEVVWILQGRGDIDWIAPYNEQMREYNDGGPNNHGAYGQRLRDWRYEVFANEKDSVMSAIGEVDQIKEAVQKLQKDPNTRQAIMSLWDPGRDNQPSKDIPCNNWVAYRLRDGILDQTVVIRSNDFIWGTPYNAVQFTHLHALVAGELGVKMGKLIYVIQNLHYYEEQYPEALGIIEEEAAWPHSSVEAICGDGFRTVTDKEIMKLVPVITEGTSEDYWNDTIPKIMGLYQLLRHQCFEANIPIAHKMLYALPAPFHELAIDSIRDSKSPFIRKVLIYKPNENIRAGA
jgi:thymidylate synthase